MKQAKFALTVVALTAIVGGTLAFKANRNIHTFYAYTTTIIGGFTTGVCQPTTTLKYFAHPNGTSIVTFADVPLTSVTTCKTRVFPSL